MEEINENSNPSDSIERSSGEVTAVTSMQTEPIHEGVEVIKSGVEDDKTLSKEHPDEVPLVKSTVPIKHSSLAESAKTPDLQTTDSFVASKRIKLDVETTKPPNLNKPVVLKHSVTTGSVHIPKGLTVTVLPAKEQPNMKQGDLNNVQPSDEDSALRSENARTPAGEEIGSFQGSQQEVVGFTASDLIQSEPEMAEEAPKLESEQTTADVPPEEQPEFDYYGCDVCKTEAKNYDRLSFTHKCPICPCMCFCSHLLKEHMRVIHGWFNIQRKFTQNY